MALVDCKECSKQISNEALTCPHCGISTPGISNKKLQEEVTRINFFQKRWVGGVPFWMGVVMVCHAMFVNGDKQAVVETWSIAKFLIGFGVLHYVISEIERNLFERKCNKAGNDK